MAGRASARTAFAICRGLSRPRRARSGAGRSDPPLVVEPRRRSSCRSCRGTGKPMSVRMTNCGPLGWVTDKERGYRYQATSSRSTGKPWPADPAELLDIWHEVSDYRQAARRPASSISIRTRRRWACIRTRTRQDSGRAGRVDLARQQLPVPRRRPVAQRSAHCPSSSSSGDVVVLGGEGRLCFHGVDRIYPGHLDAAEERRPHQPDASPGNHAIAG